MENKEIEKLKILLVEDSPDDAALVAAEFKRNGVDLQWKRVDAEPQLRTSLGDEEWDAVISDYSMPNFSALGALAVVRELKEHTVPFIVVSGSIGEERAVEAMKRGADDYILKDNLLRLVQAVKREVRESQDRAKRKQAEQALAAATQHLGRLKRFFPPKIAEFVLSGQVDPFRWHRNDVTVVFIDLRGFTSFAEMAEPEEVMNLLQEYYSVVAQVAHKNEGSVGHLAGDGVMLFFNDPVPIQDPQGKAVVMALEAKKILNGLRENWDKREFSLNFGIGIASGFATIGGIGSEGFWDYTVVGTVTNLAARLCSQANDGQILVSQKFLAGVQNLVNAAPVGKFSFKGMHREVEVVSVLGAKENP